MTKTKKAFIKLALMLIPTTIYIFGIKTGLKLGLNMQQILTVGIFFLAGATIQTCILAEKV